MVSPELGVVLVVHKVDGAVSLPGRRKCKTGRNL